MSNKIKSFDVRDRLSLLKASAKKRKIPVNLDINKYQLLIDEGCHFCGSDLSKENGYCLDRIDNNKGYNIENVVGCCKICNRSKSNMCVFEFRTWLEKAGLNVKRQREQAEILISQGFTEEMFNEIANQLMNESIQDLPKERIKLLYK